MYFIINIFHVILSFINLIKLERLIAWRARRVFLLRRIELLGKIGLNRIMDAKRSQIEHLKLKPGTSWTHRPKDKPLVTCVVSGVMHVAWSRADTRGAAPPHVLAFSADTARCCMRYPSSFSPLWNAPNATAPRSRQLVSLSPSNIHASRPAEATTSKSSSS
jgi:hypothetical protein